MSTRQSGPPVTRLSYLPGLDGLRALAVIAVVLYHAELRWIPGGFLGVEAFFVISGYLMTLLLLAEWRQRNAIDLTAFYLRRARRLLPAAFFLIGLVLAFAVVFLPHEVGGLRMDALASFGYVTNWYLVLAQKSYFEAVGRPSLLRHLWSLAVEEQFYIFWPLLLALGLRLLRRYMLPVVLLAAMASAVLMAFLFQPDADPSRLYYGTDTRASGLLIGAALAFVWVPERLARRGRAISAVALDVVGLGALLALLGFFLRLGEFEPFLYQGGFLLLALTTAVVIAIAVHPRSHLHLLGAQPLRWVGLRSYSIYLWHWPVFMVTRPHLDVPLDGLPLWALRLSLTLVLAELSYRYVESPIRHGALGRAWGMLQDEPRAWLSGPSAGLALVLSCGMVLVVAVAAAPPPTPPPYLNFEATPHAAAPVASGAPEQAANLIPPVASVGTPFPPLASPTPNPSDFETPTSPVPEPTSDEAQRSAPGVETAESLPEPTLTPIPTITPVRVGRVTAVGDSVMLGAATALQQTIGDIDVDAEVGRQAANAIDQLKARRAAGQLGEVVIIHLGNNGTFSAAQFDEMMQLLSDRREVVIVDVKVPRRWEDANNTVLTEGVKRYPNAVLVDWRAASVNRYDLFWDDGIHLRPEGAQMYAVLIASFLKGP